jgi:hypothetical protein
LAEVIAISQASLGLFFVEDHSASFLGEHRDDDRQQAQAHPEERQVEKKLFH